MGDDRQAIAQYELGSTGVSAQHLDVEPAGDAAQQVSGILTVVGALPGGTPNWRGFRRRSAAAGCRCLRRRASDHRRRARASSPPPTQQRARRVHRPERRSRKSCTRRRLLVACRNAVTRPRAGEDVPIAATIQVALHRPRDVPSAARSSPGQRSIRSAACARPTAPSRTVRGFDRCISRSGRAGQTRARGAPHTRPSTICPRQRSSSPRRGRIAGEASRAWRRLWLQASEGDADVVGTLGAAGTPIAAPDAQRWRHTLIAPYLVGRPRPRPEITARTGCLRLLGATQQLELSA